MAGMWPRGSGGGHTSKFPQNQFGGTGVTGTQVTGSSVSLYGVETPAAAVHAAHGQQPGPQSRSTQSSHSLSIWGALEIGIEMKGKSFYDAFTLH